VAVNTILVRNNTGLASGVAVSIDRECTIVGFQAVSANCILTQGSLSVADLTTPTAFNYVNEWVLFSGANNSGVTVTDFPISAGEVIYCRFSGNGSAIIYLAESPEILPQ
jgi:hypothetical protein